jgi:hypothetical protein
MKMVNMPHLKYALYAALAGGAIVSAAACGGGGSNATPATTNAGAAIPNQTTSTYNGPTGGITITFAIPARTAVSQRLRDQVESVYGPRSQNASLLTLASMTTDAKVKAAALSRKAAADASEAKLGSRAPQFISPSTYSALFILAPGNGYPYYGQGVEEAVTCSSTNCTISIPSAPVGTNLSGSLFLYDSSSYLIGEGVTSGITVTANQNTPVTITINGVLAFVGETISGVTPPLQAYPAGATNFTVGLTAMDADMNAITTSTTPSSVLVDQYFNQVSGFTITPTATDGQGYSVTPDVCVNSCPGTGTATVPLNADLTLPSTTYAYPGTGTEAQLVFTATPNSAGGNPTPNPYYSYFHSGSPKSITYGSQTLAVKQAQLQWTNPNNNGRTSGLVFTASTSPTVWNLEFASPSNSNQPIFNATETIPAAASTITLSDNGNCGSVLYGGTPYVPGAGMPQSTTDLAVTLNMASTTPSNQCQVIATDDQGRTAYLAIYVDSTSINISNKARTAR